MATGDSVDSAITAFFDEHQELHKGWLRSLHSLAEPAFEEEETSNFIYSVLKEFCPSLKVSRDVSDLPTALLAVFTPRDATQSAMLLRADMDALGIRGSDRTLSALHPEVHHACGHDGHMTCLLTLAHWVDTFPEFVHRKLVLFFQPAEESSSKAKGGSGAKVAIANGGLLDTLHNDVTAVYALHAWPGLEVGQFGVSNGVMMGMSGRFAVQMSGRGGHAGKHSESGGDALLAACTLVVCAQAVVARGTDAFAPAVAAFTQVENVGGTATNAVCSCARVYGTLRCLDSDTRDSVRTQLRRHAEAAGRMHGCSAVVEFVDGYPATCNSASGARVARAAALRVVGGDERRVRQVGLGDGMVRPSLCSEDFSLLLRKRGGAYVWVGMGKDGAGLHESGFSFDEGGIGFGGKLFVYLALSRESGGDQARWGEF